MASASPLNKNGAKSDHFRKIHYNSSPISFAMVCAISGSKPKRLFFSVQNKGLASRSAQMNLSIWNDIIGLGLS